MNKETKIQQEIMLALSEAGCTVWRNNVGMAWHGRVVKRAGNQVTLADAFKMPYGLCVGSSDIIGISPTVITQDMVGKTFGLFIAPEVKVQKKDLAEKQVIFKSAVVASGGRAGVVRSTEDALDLLKFG